MSQIIYQRAKAVHSFKQALRFFGENASVTLDSKVQFPWQSYFNFGTGDFAFSVWVYPIRRASASTARYDIIGWSRQNTGAATASIGLQLVTSDGLTLTSTASQYRTTASTYFGAFANPGFDMFNRWTHFVFQRVGTSPIQTWINGINYMAATGVAANAAMQVQGTVNYLGAAEGSASFNGYMDEFCVFNKSLTQAEILAIYNNGLGDIPPLSSFSNIISYWRFDATNGRVLTDYTTLYNNLYTPGNGTLLGYTDAQVGANGQPQSGQTAWVDHFTLAPITS